MARTSIAMPLASSSLSRLWSNALFTEYRKGDAVQASVRRLAMERAHGHFAEALDRCGMLGGGAKFLRTSFATREKVIEHSQHRANPRSDHIHNARWRELMAVYTAVRVAAALETT